MPEQQTASPVEPLTCPFTEGKVCKCGKPEDPNALACAMWELEDGD